MERTSKPVTSMSFARSQSVSKNHPKIDYRDDRPLRFSFRSVSPAPRREKEVRSSVSLSLSRLFPPSTHLLLIGRSTSESKRERERKKRGKRKDTLMPSSFSHRCSNTLQMISHREVELQSQTYGQRTGRVPRHDAPFSLRDYCHCNPIGCSISSKSHVTISDLSSRTWTGSSNVPVRVFKLLVAYLRPTGLESERELFSRLVSELFGLSGETSGDMLRA